ncbi:hypothetical protein BN874_2260006 [Candidatus Contendobacter odensis Run_B_J11]|uniref:Uncharacterized protein n=1 Tax=Candidatus Contendobacter odensis Run_B_J11 TaxID=1400861 RepID=A0A7U7GCL7_9GAMM|nr:hypothetical protein BN874_2260006 [Candidatus Contendobacter odensis Run_B_J11]
MATRLERLGGLSMTEEDQSSPSDGRFLRFDDPLQNSRGLDCDNCGY